ncbi:hypothetical protein JQ554_18065 [Bradyrhizobium diazoefficiens]|nr:hypothetical protein [Bradyrhizobium diazoefficiens]UCF52159.1 MAG: hypothetical protein JSV48_23205 [Bradyrhizobium sp.]MBR0966115.1 hypothetical protein [Bradyrhizobium diazoefficiens]MBR0979585.1 hypothetical protein [Bradyrhizobium diazoefficiens]MBR1008933.1 hypothetical protein [Bradyrhizobium diazoefficiens]MBR1015381.1 hypothetical protein [Bradyrhizobium diazoefficiens]
MTVGLARRFGDRILIIADTIISSRSAAKKDIIPGRVKAVILAEDVSAAYAGSVYHALPALQRAAQIARSNGRIEDIIEPLRATNAETVHDEELETEFLIASHRDGVAMMKVWRGGEITRGDALLWIGEPSVADALVSLESAAPTPLGWPDEVRLNWTAAQLLGDPTRFVLKNVGGFFVTLLASPVGHTYQDMAGAALCNDLRLSGATPDDSGVLGIYHYQVLHGFWRGAAVLAVYLPQPKLGFLYRPLSMDRPADVIANTSPEHLFGLISNEATAMGATIRD